MSANIQLGHLARHTPTKAGAQGREAAVVDVAQDLLLRHLHQLDCLDDLALNGGTAIRKLYAGKEGRFSLDLDFAITNTQAEADEIVTRLLNAIDGLTLEPFSYGITERRGKWSVVFRSPFVTSSTLASKLDFSPSSWLPSVRRGWISLPIHNQYGDEPLPRIQTIRLEENIAEKIARLNRTTTARDMYDLRWIMTTPELEKSLDKKLIRRLAVLKIWVDTNGMHAGSTFWKPSHEGSSFEPKRWLRQRSREDFDVQDIGALAVPTPTPEELSSSVITSFSFLSSLSEDEAIIARSDPRDRALAIKLLAALPCTCFDPSLLY